LALFLINYSFWPTSQPPSQYNFFSATQPLSLYSPMRLESWACPWRESQPEVGDGRLFALMSELQNRHYSFLWVLSDFGDVREIRSQSGKISKRRNKNLRRLLIGLKNMPPAICEKQREAKREARETKRPIDNTRNARMSNRERKKALYSLRISISWHFVVSKGTFLFSQTFSTINFGRHKSR
jgi:hypothetical protein